MGSGSATILLFTVGMFLSAGLLLCVDLAQMIELEKKLFEFWVGIPV